MICSLSMITLCTLLSVYSDYIASDIQKCGAQLSGLWADVVTYDIPIDISYTAVMDVISLCIYDPDLIALMLVNYTFI